MRGFNVPLRQLANTRVDVHLTCPKECCGLVEPCGWRHTVCHSDLVAHYHNYVQFPFFFCQSGSTSWLLLFWILIDSIASRSPIPQQHLLLSTYSGSQRFQWHHHQHISALEMSVSSGVLQGTQVDGGSQASYYKFSLIFSPPLPFWPFLKLRQFYNISTCPFFPSKLQSTFPLVYSNKFCFSLPCHETPSCQCQFFSTFIFCPSWPNTFKCHFHTCMLCSYRSRLTTLCLQQGLQWGGYFPQGNQRKLLIQTDTDECGSGNVWLVHLNATMTGVGIPFFSYQDFAFAIKNLVKTMHSISFVATLPGVWLSCFLCG